MKASEYSEQFDKADDKLVAIRTIGAGFLREVGTLGKQRGCKTDKSLFALLSEQDAKWRKLARLQPDILPNAFEVVVEHEMPDLFRRWRGSRKSPTAS